MEQKIYEILKERFGIEDTINSDTDLVNQLGFESISLVELASVLSKETGVKVTHNQAIKWTTVKSILSTLAATSKDTMHKEVFYGIYSNSIIIKKEINELFEIINDVRNWPELHNYQDVKILEKKKLLDGRRKIVFQVTGNKEEEPVEIWTSQRIIDVTNMCARGVRLEPMYPFRHWILDVVLSVEKEGTKMTWIQDFSMDKNSGFTEEAVEEMINKGSKKELQIFKEKIERWHS